MVRSTVPAGLAVMVWGGMVAAQEGQGGLLRPELAPLEFLAGSCWTGVFPGSETFDVHCYDPVFGGQFVRDVHAVPQGADVYRGETLYHWDGEAGEIRYRYYNSIGGVSDGTAVADGDRIRFPDETYRGEDGTVRVFSTVWERSSADGYRVVTQELVEDPQGDWAEGEAPMVIEFRRISRQEANELIPGGLQ
jgi:hypothetical protein